VNCLTVRERLPEHALGALPPGDASVVDRHLEWCAACRKEAGELQRAAATLAYSVAPVEPPAELEDRVVETVRIAASRRRATAPRRSRVAAAGVLAAMLALSGLGWGAVMAGRAGRLEDQVQNEIERRQQALDRFRRTVIAQIEGADPETVIESAALASPRGRSGGGDATVVLAPSTDDLVLVAVIGLDGLRTQQFPLQVRLVGRRANDFVVGRIRELDSGNGGVVWGRFVESLTAFDAVEVRDARGRVLLRGELGARKGLPSGPAS
jgi:anti-sigma factor RsiW